LQHLLQGESYQHEIASKFKNCLVEEGAAKRRRRRSSKISFSTKNESYVNKGNASPSLKN
jgi:hypothetical protein